MPFVNLKTLFAGMLILFLHGCSLMGSKPVVVDSQAAEAAPLPEQLQQDFAGALALLDEENYDDALVSLLAVTEQYPTYPGPWVNLAITQLKLEQYEDALASVDRAIILDAEFCQAPSLKGIIERQLGKFKESKISYEKALACNPNDINSLYNLGVLLDLYLHEEAKALEYYQVYLAKLGEQQDETVQGWVVDLKRRVKRSQPQEPAPAAVDEQSGQKPEQQIAEEG